MAAAYSYLDETAVPVVTIVDQFGGQMTWRKKYGRVIINPITICYLLSTNDSLLNDSALSKEPTQ